VTNAVKYGGRSCGISTAVTPDGLLTVSVSDSGDGPPTDQQHTGMGSRIVKAFAKNLDAVVEPIAGPQGYTVRLTVPLGVGQKHAE
jgi:two-component sensor histidine kinase